MPELHIERIFKLRNFPPVDIRVVVSSTEGAIMGTAQTGGRMQITMSTPRAVRINAGILPPRKVFEMPMYVIQIIRDAGRSMGSAACFPSRFSISCTIENVSLTQEQAVKILEMIGRKFEQQVERVEYEEPGVTMFRAGIPAGRAISESIYRHRPIQYGRRAYA